MSDLETKRDLFGKFPPARDRSIRYNGHLRGRHLREHVMPNADSATTTIAADSARRRTMIVWASLLGAMTTVGGLLLTLEGESAPRMDGLALAAPVAAAGATPIDAIFRTRADLDAAHWEGVVIHHSGSSFGSASSLASDHQGRGLHGLGYHFVIGNGSGADDGELHVGYRWLDQLPGAHAGGPDEEFFNRRYIGICLIGDGDRRGFTEAQVRRLTQLVSALQQRLDLPAERITLHRDIASTSSPGRHFPEAAFRTSLTRAGEPWQGHATR
ncbi:MAG: N-acetylmuramoyl-L-alanine amidase [Phycisphaeraceae bacterium]|nr:MAG: N-acetylmuramoyl-L-alanine amidase [Phycisphaeraceae bacterium]